MPTALRLNHPVTPLQECVHPLFDQRGISLWIKRDDLNHPAIQGNKWHKLKLNLAYAHHKGFEQLLTFGGAYSNHIAAVAEAGNLYGWQTFGFIRGDELESQQQAWSSTLKKAAHNGMQLVFLDRKTYRLRDDQAWLHALQQHYPRAYILPEGGSNPLALDGFESLITELNQQLDFTHLLCAVGSGGTLAGLVKYAKPDQQVWGIATLKQAEYLIPRIQGWAGEDKANWRLCTAFHGGGYGKTTEDITRQAQVFEKRFDVPLDPVYTAKLIYGFNQLLERNEFKPGSRIVLYHSGGLQGRQVQDDCVLT
ncbi:pyridoxal-phosphate dependent enzyme [Thiomicrospira sp. R3]|uniref:1-aminocyclopropane-1-carboxylate deaminase/D-cysteine desulfhydrase n=1 Tax=Thiomicrospira sp. R3 TaxID=3035472 RepID=UPI00259BE110|nr:pyridoxal-phosphate dependent enzyme [Thiomicrospira sp. R3]WFE68460.1 pyridoxal-phosphate dependent enzyme [Thiomicrospira sp. R3]